MAALDARPGIQIDGPEHVVGFMGSSNHFAESILLHMIREGVGVGGHACRHCVAALALVARRRGWSLDRQTHNVFSADQDQSQTPSFRAFLQEGRPGLSQDPEFFRLAEH